jgi:hypothetical protein
MKHVTENNHDMAMQHPDNAILRDCIGAIKQLYFLNKEDFKPRKLFME